MHKKVIVKFFKVRRHSVSDPSADDIFTIIRADMDADKKMERDVGDELFVQMDRLSKEDKLWVGEISRNQKTNFPHEVTPQGPRPLSTKNNLGHGISFVYDTEASALAIQFDTRTVSPNKLINYLHEFGGNSLWIEAILRKGVLGKFEKLPTKKVEIRVASPKTFSALDGEDMGTFINGVADTYGGASIAVTISAGRGEKFLKKEVKSMIKKLLKNPEDLRGLKVTTDRPKDDEDHALNLIKDLLSNHRDLKIDDRNPEKRFKTCSAFVKESYTKHRAYIKSVYKAKKA